ncbi:MAG: tRNA lysidine(34) synthetase TilS [Hoeflea sp.]|uniref:tRNA lysidine(34) synthetase TilS n=1 Tax=Hoeflea sp. TaxID=1940281 RepID=UPI003EF1E5C7
MKLGVPGGPALEPQHIDDCLSNFYARLTDHRPLGVAVSGGSDSLGLLYGLASLVPPEKLVALTVDHGLRRASADEARWVKAQCRRLGIRHETLKWEGCKPVSGVQAAARAARYRLLVDASARLGLAAVLTAHTRDDQNETVMMRRARSPSEDAPGLAGIPTATLFEGRMWVLRPMLGLCRESVRTFLRSQGVCDWVEDPSNVDTRFERVRVRAQLNEASGEAVVTDGSHIAKKQFRLASGAAQFIDTTCHVDGNGLVWMRNRETGSADVVTAALEALIDWQGGAARPLDRRGKATLAGFLSSISKADGNSTVSLGRSLVQRRGACLTVRRECRDIGKLVLEPGQSGVWDRRFLVRNLASDSSLVVSGGGNAGVLPCFTRNQGEYSSEVNMDDGVIGGFICQPLLGRSSHILPSHQLPLAQALARLAIHNTLPECPWGYSLGAPG